jgi:hypothetical protein
MLKVKIVSVTLASEIHSECVLLAAEEIAQGTVLIGPLDIADDAIFLP